MKLHILYTVSVFLLYVYNISFYNSFMSLPFCSFSGTHFETFCDKIVSVFGSIIFPLMQEARVFKFNQWHFESLQGSDGIYQKMEACFKKSDAPVTLLDLIFFNLILTASKNNKHLIMTIDK